MCGILNPIIYPVKIELVSLFKGNKTGQWSQSPLVGLFPEQFVREAAQAVPVVFQLNLSESGMFQQDLNLF